MCSLGPPLHANATCDNGCRGVAGDAIERLDEPVAGVCRTGQGRHADTRGFDEGFLDRPEPIETLTANSSTHTWACSVASIWLRVTRVARILLRRVHDLSRGKPAVRLLRRGGEAGTNGFDNRARIVAEIEVIAVKELNTAALSAVNLPGVQVMTIDVVVGNRTKYGHRDLEGLAGMVGVGFLQCKIRPEHGREHRHDGAIRENIGRHAAEPRQRGFKRAGWKRVTRGSATGQVGRRLA